MSPFTMSRLARVGLTLAVIAAGARLAAYLHYHQYEWIYVDQALPLEPSDTQARDFVLPVDGPAWITVAVGSSPSAHRSVAGANEREDPLPVDITWSVIGEGRTIASGASASADDGTYSDGREAGVILGRFEGKGRQRYTVEYRVNASLRDAGDAPPRLVVAAPRSGPPMMTRFGHAQLLGVLEGLSVLGAGVALFVWLVRKGLARWPGVVRD